MFDSHCHLDDEAYDQDRDEVLGRARAAGVRGILVPGFEPSEWPRLGPLCRRDPMLACAVGLHPWYVHALSDEARGAALAELPARLQEAGAVAVGECGLDAPKAKRGGAPMDLQLAVLARHVEVARASTLPIILHCVRAHGALLDLLEAGGPLDWGGVLHSYSGPPELIGRYARLNLSFSFSGTVTRPAARKSRAALAAVPRARLLVESDGPDQPAEGHPTGRSEPCDILRVLATAAELRGETVEALGEAVEENARALFDLP